LRSDSKRLEYAAESIDLVLEWTVDGREQFLGDFRTQAAVLYLLHTLTQALRDLSEELRARYPEVPFRAMSGFRTVIVHDFLSLDRSVIFSVIEDYLPPLKIQVAQMLADLDRPHS
jgi:uncharacterized protein with HEPN domain